jgi:hypothetical protein
LPDTPPESSASLKVVLIGDTQDINGYIVAFNEGERAEDRKEVSGKGLVETIFPTVRPGSKHVVFVPRCSYAPASQPIFLSSGQHGEVSLRLNATSTFRGIVVDMLQQPLEGAYIQVTMENIFPPQLDQATSFPVSMLSVRNVVASRISGYSYYLQSNGSLSLRTLSDPEGRFEIDGVVGSSARAKITYENISTTQTWPLDREAYIILPVYKEPPPPESSNEEYDELSRIIDTIVEKLGQNPQLDKIYWQQIRELMIQRLSKSRLSKKEKARLQKIIDTVGREPKSEEK